MKNGSWFMKIGPCGTGSTGGTGFTTQAKMAGVMPYKVPPNPPHHSHMINRREGCKTFCGEMFYRCHRCHRCWSGSVESEMTLEELHDASNKSWPRTATIAQSAAKRSHTGV